jgi:hypothetical protein
MERGSGLHHLNNGTIRDEGGVTGISRLTDRSTKFLMRWQVPDVRLGHKKAV